MAAAQALFDAQVSSGDVRDAGAVRRLAEAHLTVATCRLQRREFATGYGIFIIIIILFYFLLRVFRCYFTRRRGGGGRGAAPG